VAAGAGYVICDACGARVKAARRRCPRCEELLVPRAAAPAAGTPARPSEVATFIRMTVGAIVALATVAMMWPFRSDSDAHVATLTAKTNAAPPLRVQAALSGVPVDPPAYERAMARDTMRAAGVAFASADFDSARATYEQALEKNPNDPEALNGLGQALVRLGRVADAIQDFERAASIAPDTWAYRFNLAHAVGQLGNWDRAITEYREAARLFPTDYATQYNLAMALHKKGDEQSAVAEFRRAIELAPSEPTFRLSLGISLEKLGRIPEAAREYQAFLEMDPSSAEATRLKAHINDLSAAPSSAPVPKPNP
jgi:Flp pilus assembly protein TadD